MNRKGNNIYFTVDILKFALFYALRSEGMVFDYYIFSDIDVDFGIRLCPDLFNCHTYNILET